MTKTELMDILYSQELQIQNLKNILNEMSEKI